MIIIKKFKKTDTVHIANLISKTFAKFNNKEGNKKGIKRYIDFYNPKNNIEKIKNIFSRSQLFFVALEKNKIVGVIRGNKNRIINLFVDGKYHNKGIGKKLLIKFENECLKNKSKEIKTRASLYAVEFYKKQGYKKTTGIRNMMGLKIQPMIKKFS